MPPIKLISQIRIPPIIELKTSFKIFFKGIIKILPITKKIHIQDIIIKTFIFTAFTSIILYVQYWTNIHYPAILFLFNLLYNLVFKS